MNQATSDPTSLTSSPYRRLGVLILLLILHAGLVHDLIRKETPTLDEVAHLPAGQSYLDQASFAMYRHSPPGARLLAAIASSPNRLNLDNDGGWRTDQPANHWRFAFETVARYSDPSLGPVRYLSAFTWGRHATLIWSVAAMLVLYLWGSEWAGPSVGLVASALWALCPNIIAHASLVTTDLAATSAGVISLYLFQRWRDHRTWTSLAAASLALGVAQWVKHSSLWLYFIVAVWLFIASLSSVRQSLTLWVGGLWIAIGSILVLNAGYLFEGTGSPLGSFPFLSQTLTRPLSAGEVNPDVASTNNLTYRDIYARRVNRFRGTSLDSIPVPLPYHYLAGFDEQKFEAEGKYPMYMRGRFAEPIAPPKKSSSAEIPPPRRGWWIYYPYALAIKVPIATWVLVAIGLVGGVLTRYRKLAIAWLALGLVPIATMTLLTDINLGLRYVLGSLPFFFLIAGLAATLLPRPFHWVFITLAFASNGFSLARIHPHELSYFSEIVGGPAHGRWHLIDSNIDWGQDLRSLARWLDAHPEWAREISIAYAGTVPLEFEGIRNAQLPPRDLRYIPDRFLFPWEKREDADTWGPKPGKYAISVNFERVMRFHTPISSDLIDRYGASLHGSLLPGSIMAQMPKGSLAYFQEFQPIIEPAVGYSILLFDLSIDDVNRVRAKMGLPPWAK